MICGDGTTVSWRLTFWFGLSFAVVFFLPVVCLPETYYSILTITHMYQIYDLEHRDNAMCPAEKKRRHNLQEIEVFLKPLHHDYGRASRYVHVTIFGCDLCNTIEYLLF